MGKVSLSGALSQRHCEVRSQNSFENHVRLSLVSMLACPRSVGSPCHPKTGPLRAFDAKKAINDK